MPLLFFAKFMKKILIFFLLLYLPFKLLSDEENFLLMNNSTNEILLEFGPRINERITPCSSFKIALSLMGYDAKILKDRKDPTWVFQEGYVTYLDSWKISQLCMKNSCIWYSQC